MSILVKSDKIFEIFKEENPDPKTELEYANLYTLLVAVSLSAQTTDAAVNKATQALFEKASSARKMIELGHDELLEHIRSLNFCYTKAKNIIAMSEILMNKHNEEVPLEFEELVKLPGVGRKTANVVINCWLGASVMPVDTHVYRVGRRLGLAKSEDLGRVEQELLGNISSQYLPKAHHWLILHGRYICKARKPLCGECKVRNYCDYFGGI
ncbi:MAG: endonuclease III [Rickettsiaceae bacterium]|nr:endonuclease III [Rickettsiaceae bacterium]